MIRKIPEKVAKKWMKDLKPSDLILLKR
jgi:hypothetical protein